jgi:hypothetical protein
LLAGNSTGEGELLPENLSSLTTEERMGMENNEQEIMEQFESATTLLERTLSWLEERHGAGEVEKLSATVEQGLREAELGAKLAAAERELADLKAAAAQSLLNPLRKTVPATTTEMLAKHGISEGPVDVRTLDAALAGLSLEQRIAVKSQLLRAGAIA